MAEKGFLSPPKVTVINFKAIILELFRHWIPFIFCSMGQQSSLQNSICRSLQGTFFSKQGRKSKTSISSRAKINCSWVFLKEIEKWERNTTLTGMVSANLSGRDKKYKHTAIFTASQIQWFPPLSQNKASCYLGQHWLSKSMEAIISM